MNNNDDNILTKNQFILILIGSMIGIGVLSLPNDVIKIAKQDAWISVILGAAYPLYVMFFSSYISKKYPKENILIISQKFLGNILGNIVNIIFLIYFLLLATEVGNGITNVLEIYMVPFLNRWTVLIVSYLVIAYAVYGGGKTVARINEVIFFGTVIIFFMPLISIKDGSFLNMKPILGSGIINIIKAVEKTFFAYAGIESICIIYPFLQDSKKIKRYTLVSITITTTIYTLFTLATILFFGIDASFKFLWPVVTLTESIMVPVINSLRYIFMAFWTLIMFKTACNYYYIFTYGLNQIIKKVQRKNMTIIILPVMIVLSFLYENATKTGKFLDKIMPIFVGFNSIYVLLITVLVFLKDRTAKKNSIK
ncbi:spore germination protein (amino acid permease) [Clostridium tetanomorphum]|uniref:GerAB/ArcD/ProY family transporter n=1 Tax=Clostridium tetanomorphum TaxID=1553 RepID=UPI00044F675C|nr:endospore germination permease [Clostridium tetanomorphum]KAJ53473.1 spore germination protein [Clostridium tetanomorphum DSM 665]MBP1865296.1 spore germination protein (amino acid permease) [Clostridium tetanomorphum]NRS85219.1 spore germination protein (amino acid permease) [Clostridium tetanomorphum]SQC03072.1 spore germination protein [Clostridium tetanomorphum]